MASRKSSVSAGGVAGAVTKKNKADEGKTKIEVSLCINGVRYEYGKLCTFCVKLKAIFHCPECTDFYCVDCDITAHSTKKRKDHKRYPISMLDIPTAKRFMKNAVVWHGHLKSLQKRARQVLRRYFDRTSLCHYYYNPVYRTTSWRKPYCLRKEELFPFMTEYYGASKIQLLHRIWKAREAVKARLNAQYTKIFDRHWGRFYYAFHGKSKLLPKQSWHRPRFYGKRGFPKDVKPIYTKDVASLIIQRKWRTLLVYRMLWALARATYEQQWDPVTGKMQYFQKDQQVMYSYKPKIMYNQPWDPYYMPDWPPERVLIFLRRIGLKQYVKSFELFGIDGAALVLMDDEDFDNLEVWSRIHRKKILVEKDKIYQRKATDSASEEHNAKRDAIRKKKLFTITACKIQCAFRCHVARNELAMRRELRRLELVEEQLKKDILFAGQWWSRRKDIPSAKLFLGDTSISITALLPPIKLFGRKRDHLSTRGWGRYHGLRQRFEALKSSSSSDDASGGDAANPTQALTKKLSKGGYDFRRDQRFRGLFAPTQAKKKAESTDDEEDLTALPEAKRREILRRREALRRSVELKKQNAIARKLGLPEEDELDDIDNL